MCVRIFGKVRSTGHGGGNVVVEGGDESVMRFRAFRGWCMCELIDWIKGLFFVSCLVLTLGARFPFSFNITRCNENCVTLRNILIVWLNDKQFNGLFRTCIFFTMFRWFSENFREYFFENINANNLYKQGKTNSILKNWNYGIYLI